MVVDPLVGLREAIDAVTYNLILSLAGLHWSLLRGFIMMGYTVELVNDWLSQNAFAPLIAQTNASLSLAVSLAFVIALLVLGLTYLLAALIRLDVVNLRSAITWYIAGALFFALGPALYAGMNDFRTQIAQGFYLSTLGGLQGTMGATFDSLRQVQSSDLALGPLCDYLGVYLPGATGPGAIDGLDVALAYLRAGGPDVMGYPYPLFSPGCPMHRPHPLTGATISSIPHEWYLTGSYFDILRSPYFFPTLDDIQRAEAISMAAAAHGRMLTAWPLVLFGVVEQLVYLLITIAMGITFLSFSLAILFAFFRKTEVIARSIVDQWLELIVQTVVIAMVQSLVVAFFLAGTASGNGMVVLGIGLICLIFMLIVLWSGIRAVWNALNRLFNAMGQATGGVLLTPGIASRVAGSAGTSAAGGAVSLGAAALAGMSALNTGATMAQAAGVSLGASRTLTGAARTLAYLPGVRNTPLGDAAEQFTEGSITRQVAGNVPLIGRAAGPILGAKLLTDRDPERAELDEQGRVIARPMLVPAVGEGLASWSVPRGAQRPQPGSAPEFIEDEDGQMLPVSATRQRFGTFTPTAALSPDEPQQRSGPQAERGQEDRRQQRSDYAAEMQGEEMEQHLSDVMRTSTGVNSTLGSLVEDANTQDARQDASQLGQIAAQLQSSADQLARAAQLQLMVGQLRVSGVPDVASVMADVVGQVQAEAQAERGDKQARGINTLEVGQRMAQVMGVTPQSETSSPIQRDLARFGLFIDQALRLGLSPQQTEQIIREVQASPERRLRSDTREGLDRQVQSEQNLSWLKARDQVDQLERSARLLPPEIVAYGAMQVNVQMNEDTNAAYNQAMQDSSALSGSANVTRGGE